MAHEVPITVTGLRAARQDLLAPSLGRIEATQAAHLQRFDAIDKRLDRMEERSNFQFDSLRRQIDTYNDVQQLKLKMAVLEAKEGKEVA